MKPNPVRNSMPVVYSIITLEVNLILKDRSTNNKKLNVTLINPNLRNASKIKYKLVLMECQSLSKVVFLSVENLYALDSMQNIFTLFMYDDVANDKCHLCMDCIKQLVNYNGASNIGFR